MMRIPDSRERMKEAFGTDLKGKVSPVLYVTGILLAFVEPWLGLIPFVVVALIWLVPDRRIERYLAAHATRGPRQRDASASGSGGRAGVPVRVQARLSPSRTRCPRGRSSR